MSKTVDKVYLRLLAESSTRVVSWNAHSQYDKYRPGKATVRGPYFRWLVVEGGDCGTADGKMGAGVADLYDDARFAAAAMNNLVPLLDENEQLEKELSFARRVAIVRGETIDRMEAEIARLNAEVQELRGREEDEKTKLLEARR